MNIIEHPNYAAAKERLRLVLGAPQAPRLVFIVGPSGAGKTTLRHDVFRELFGNFGLWKRGTMPIAEVMVDLASSAYFSSFGLVKKLFAELNSPAFQWLVDQSGTPSSALTRLIESVGENDEIPLRYDSALRVEREHWRILPKLLKARGVGIVSLEHATQLRVNRANLSPVQHILHLMSLVDEANVTLVLTGTPQMAELWQSREEVLRRSVVIGVSPYRLASRADTRAFTELLRKLAALHPIPPDILREVAPDVFTVSGGVVGLAAQLLDRAVDNARADHRERVNKGDFERAWYSPSEHAQIKTRINEYWAATRMVDTVTLRQEVRRARLFEVQNDDP